MLCFFARLNYSVSANDFLSFNNKSLNDLHNWMNRLSPKRCHVACWTPVFNSQVIASQTPRLLPYPLPLEKTWTGKTGFCLKTLSGCHSSTRKRPNNNNNNKKKKRPAQEISPTKSRTICEPSFCKRYCSPGGVNQVSKPWCFQRSRDTVTDMFLTSKKLPPG